MTDEERRKLAETLKAANADVLEEIVREAETFLAEQLKAGLAADQRAINTAVILAAILAAVVGGTATIISAKMALGWHVFGIAPLIAGLAIGLVFALRAARPTSFSYSGNNPAKWVPDITEGRSLHTSLAGQAAIYAQGISANIRCLNEGHTSLKVALWAAMLGFVTFIFLEFIIVCSLIAKNGLWS